MLEGSISAKTVDLKFGFIFFVLIFVVLDCNFEGYEGYLHGAEISASWPRHGHSCEL